MSTSDLPWFNETQGARPRDMDLYAAIVGRPARIEATDGAEADESVSVPTLGPGESAPLQSPVSSSLWARVRRRVAAQRARVAPLVNAMRCRATMFAASVRAHPRSLLAAQRFKEGVRRLHL